MAVPKKKRAKRASKRPEARILHTLGAWLTQLSERESISIFRILLEALAGGIEDEAPPPKSKSKRKKG